MRKGSYFFVLDVFLAGAIVLTTLILIQTSQITAPEERTVTRSSEQFMDYLMSTDLRDSQNQFVQEHLIGENASLQTTLYEEILKLYFKHDPLLTPLLANLTEDAIQPSQGIMILINNTIKYNRSISTMNDSEVLVSTQKIGYYRENMTSFHGPTILEVRMWY
ncbi:MAG: hypothetical protein ABIA93_06295 [Candidatus Woesearchaeota archaeon]